MIKNIILIGILLLLLLLFMKCVITSWTFSIIFSESIKLFIYLFKFLNKKKYIPIIILYFMIDFATTSKSIFKKTTDNKQNFKIIINGVFKFNNSNNYYSGKNILFLDWCFFSVQCTSTTYSFIRNLRLGRNINNLM